jgi:hypothetical protein
MTTHIVNDKVFEALGAGDTVIGDRCTIKSGRGYTVIGNECKCYGSCLTVLGNDVYVEGSDSIIKGNRLTVRGPRQRTVGTMISMQGGTSPHALPTAPPGAPVPDTNIIMEGCTIGISGDRAVLGRGEVMIVPPPGSGPIRRRGAHRAQREEPLTMGGMVFHRGVKIASGGAGDGIVYKTTATGATADPSSPAVVIGDYHVSM